MCNRICFKSYYCFRLFGCFCSCFFFICHIWNHLKKKKKNSFIQLCLEITFIHVCQKIVINCTANIFRKILTVYRLPARRGGNAAFSFLLSSYQRVWATKQVLFKVSISVEHPFFFYIHLFIPDSFSVELLLLLSICSIFMLLSTRSNAPWPSRRRSTLVGTILT